MDTVNYKNILAVWNAEGAINEPWKIYDQFEMNFHEHCTVFQESFFSPFYFFTALFFYSVLKDNSKTPFDFFVGWKLVVLD